MAERAASLRNIPKDTTFYRDNYAKVIYGVMIAMVFMQILMIITIYQVTNRPLPSFQAKDPEGKTLPLVSFDEPNLLPETIIRFASKVAVGAYTYDFNDAAQRLSKLESNFTPGGWIAFKDAARESIKTVQRAKVLVNAVVSDPPVISNEGELEGLGYSWRVQVPVLISYTGGDRVKKSKQVIILTLVKIPTTENPQGIGIAQFETR